MDDDESTDDEGIAYNPTYIKSTLTRFLNFEDERTENPYFAKLLLFFKSDESREIFMKEVIDKFHISPLNSDSNNEILLIRLLNLVDNLIYRFDYVRRYVFDKIIIIGKNLRYNNICLDIFLKNIVKYKSIFTSYRAILTNSLYFLKKRFKCSIPKNDEANLPTSLGKSKIIMELESTYIFDEILFQINRVFQLFSLDSSKITVFNDNLILNNEMSNRLNELLAKFTNKGPSYEPLIKMEIRNANRALQMYRNRLSDYDYSLNMSCMCKSHKFWKQKIQLYRDAIEEVLEKLVSVLPEDFHYSEIVLKENKNSFVVERTRLLSDLLGEEESDKDIETNDSKKNNVDDIFEALLR
eukprot:TRINITY_DN14560_c0_g1_i1.p1 TRINITY_DN14560_c0_g1~~TRINITY_DN14560_c0_g1_i1.p1  ORF type:complete len:354 (+),score=96.82 TRINITY_DN14560_c0_g1_i1:33-1094(+)